MERTDGLEPNLIKIVYQDGSELELDKALVVYEKDKKITVETTQVSLEYLLFFYKTLGSMIEGILKND